MFIINNIFRRIADKIQIFPSLPSETHDFTQFIYANKNLIFILILNIYVIPLFLLLIDNPNSTML